MSNEDWINSERKLPAANQINNWLGIFALIFFAVVPVSLHPERMDSWLMMGIGIILIPLLAIKASTVFFVGSNGVTRRRLFRRDRLNWDEIEAVGKDIIRGKYGQISVEICVYGQ